LRFSRASVGPHSHARLEPGTSKAGSGRDLLTRLSSTTDGLPVPGRRRVTWRPSVGQTAGSGDPRRTAGSEDPRGTRQIRSENSRDPRAVKTNFAACPRPLWVKVVRLPGLADCEDVADWIPRVVGDRVGDDVREAVGGELQALGEAAVVLDLNSIVDAPSESEAPRPVADAPVVEAPIPAGTQHGPDDSSGSEGRRYSLGRLRSSFPAALLRKPDRPMRRVSQGLDGTGPPSRRGPDVRPRCPHPA